MTKKVTYNLLNIVTIFIVTMFFSCQDSFVYTNTDLIDMQDNVVITTHDNRVLKTDQLFYDQKKEWLSTNKPVSFKTEQDLINGNGFDSNSSFSNAEVLEVTGIITLDE